MTTVRSQLGWHAIARIPLLPGSPKTVALGTAIGLFLAFTPTLGVQMMIAATLAIVLRGSASAAVAAVWVSNPLTVGPIYAATYGLGVLVLPGSGPITALLVGGALAGLVAALVGYRLVFYSMQRRDQPIIAA